MTSRRNELVGSLSVSQPQDVVKRLSRLFMRFPSTRIAENQIEATMAAYASDLVMYPLWAIDVACRQIIAGLDGGSKAFLPSSTELQAACERAVAPTRLEARQLTRVLNADVYCEPTPEERAKVAAEFQALVQKLKLNMDPRDNAKPSRPLTRHEAEAALERAKINPVPAPAFSEGLRQHLGLAELEKGAAV